MLDVARFEAGSTTALAFDCERIGIRVRDEIRIFSSDGEPLGRGLLPVDAEEGWPLYFSPNGDELWLFDAGGVMHRLGLPR